MPIQKLLLVVALAASAIAGTLVSSTQVSFGFGTINGLGQSAEHEKITRLGLARFGLGEKTMSEIAGKAGSLGAVGAPDNPVRGLISSAEAHCDGADTLADQPGYPQSPKQAQSKLGNCRNWIMRHLNEAVISAGDLVDASGGINDSEIPTFVSCTYNGKPGRAKCNVLEAIGLALHAAQDFYSHTNWTDAPVAGDATLTNPPGLGNNGRARWLDPRRRDPYPAGMFSGCFEGIPESLHCKGRIRHADLNKDKGAITVSNGSIGEGRTPRGKINSNFARAAKAAIEDTADKWAYFEQQVRSKYGKQRGQTIVCVIRADDPDRCR